MTVALSPTILSVIITIQEGKNGNTGEADMRVFCYVQYDWGDRTRHGSIGQDRTVQSGTIKGALMSNIWRWNLWYQGIRFSTSPFYHLFYVIWRYLLAVIFIQILRMLRSCTVLCTLRQSAYLPSTNRSLRITKALTSASQVSALRQALPVLTILSPSSLTRSRTCWTLSVVINHSWRANDKRGDGKESKRMVLNWNGRSVMMKEL